MLLRQLRKRLGDLDPAVEEQIESLSADRLEQLGEALLDFNSPCRPGRLAAIASVGVGHWEWRLPESMRAAIAGSHAGSAAPNGLAVSIGSGNAGERTIGI